MQVHHLPPPQKVISGGQTGADRAGLDWALSKGIPIGGWCPRGRRSEDKEVPLNYPLVETPKSDYRERTLWNVRDADVTLLFTLNAQLTGGSLQTLKFAKQLGKTCLHIHPQALRDQSQEIIQFLQNIPNGICNIAGSRESKSPRIYHFTRVALDLIFSHGLQSANIYLADPLPIPAQLGTPTTDPVA